MSTDKVTTSPFNPVDHMETDEEIIIATTMTSKGAYIFVPANL